MRGRYARQEMRVRKVPPRGSAPGGAAAQVSGSVVVTAPPSLRCSSLRACACVCRMRVRKRRRKSVLVPGAREDIARR